MDIVHEFEIKASAEAVYKALTTEAGINGWWSKNCDMPETVGEMLKVRFTEHNVEMGFRIDELDSNSRVKWTGVENPNPAFINTHIQFDIEESTEGVKFRFNHSNWDEQWNGQIQYEQSVGTWQHFMNSLKSYLETGEGQPW